MSVSLITRLTAHKPGLGPVADLESRLKKFLNMEQSTESLDGPEFSFINGSKRKADFLLGTRRFVTELKTICGNPTERLESHLKARFAQPDAPIVFGSACMEAILRGMNDAAAIRKMICDVSARAVRRHFRDANEQIGATKSRLSLDRGVGLLILANDLDKLNDVGTIAYATRMAFESTDQEPSNIDYVWITVESHLIDLENGGTGYPQLLISRSNANARDLHFLGSMIASWARYNSSEMASAARGGFWEAMRPVYKGDPPHLSLF